MNRYHYGDGEMDGYVMFTLSQAPAANWTDAGKVTIINHYHQFNIFLQPECYYKGFRDEEGQFTPVHW